MPVVLREAVAVDHPPVGVEKDWRGVGCVHGLQPTEHGSDGRMQVDRALTALCLGRVVFM
jgi:hypothetical protein